MRTLWTLWVLSLLFSGVLAYHTVEVTESGVTIHLLGVFMCGWAWAILFTHCPWLHPSRRRKDGAA